MKKILFASFILTTSVLFAGNSSQLGHTAFKPSAIYQDETIAEIEWLDFETAIDRNKEERKFIFIDIYTGWCGWCKKMDASTFKDPEVAAYMNEHFYAVKMDAESKKGIVFKEVLYEYKIYNNGKGYNELAVNLLSSKMTFPSFVVLSKREVKLGTIVGFQKPKELLSALKKYTKK